jgi:small GTP-binding protein
MGCEKSKNVKNDEKKIIVKSKSQPQQRFKLVLLGSSSVGKTSIATCYCLGALNKQYGPTIGGVYFKKECKLMSGAQITINIWDTAGEEKYRSMASL